MSRSRMWGVFALFRSTNLTGLVGTGIICSRSAGTRIKCLILGSGEQRSSVSLKVEIKLPLL